MKAGILTYYNVHNHGSALQSYASKKVLNSLGYEVQFLDFERNYDFISVDQSKKYKIGLKSIPFYFKYMFQKGLSNILFNLKKHNVLNRFTVNMIGEGIRYSDYQGDLVYIGSDEVFSFEIGINPFFYGIGIQVDKVISYAASFGPTTIEYIKTHRLDGLLEGGLSHIDSIAVRDFNSKSIVETISKKKATIVCDPVILYGYKEEQQLYKPKIKNKYILIYSYDKNLNDKKSIGMIRSFAKKNKLKIYSVGYHHKWCDKNICPDPIELLVFFKNASFVFTNTFHGAVISLITEAQMIVQISGNQNKLRYLLTEYGLENRILENDRNINEIVSIDIDYTIVNEKIEGVRKNSFSFIKSAVNAL